ncbi:MAG: hypothetical protein RJB65_836 [Actinomycetota bacterium]
MTLRVKIVLALTTLAIAATAAIGVISYSTTAHSLRNGVDRSLSDAAARIAERPSIGDPDGDGDGDGGRGGGGRGDGDRDRPRSFEQVLVQVIDPSGAIILAPSSGELPVTRADRAVAASSDPNASVRHEFEIDDEPYRVLTVKFPIGAVQLARSLEESERALAEILRGTLVAMVIVAALSLLIGWLIARQMVRRLERLTVAAGEVAATGRLDVDVPVDGADETGMLGRAFAGMLDALRRSRDDQQRLVQDAGHELRTPLTSLRTNVSVLRRKHDALTPDSREQLLADLDSETRELTDLVNELVALATEQRGDEPVQPVRLGDVVDRAVERIRRRHQREVVVRVDESVVDGRPGAIERAVQNLLENACKFAPDGPIEIDVLRGAVSVRDHGAGLDEADVPHLFDRFYRAVGSRSLPGSGLGLSIVASVASVHGGSVFARNAADGGAVIGFILPVRS